jgi:ribosomal protein S12 methylthiotransferase
VDPVLTKIGLVQLGCPKNQVDGEEILGSLLSGQGAGSCEVVGDRSAADILIVNTCTFIESAKTESINAILEAVELKKQGKVSKVFVTGCLAQRYAKELEEQIPEVDGLLGIESGSALSNVVFGPTRLKPQNLVTPETLTRKYLAQPSLRARAGGQNWTAYLKVSEGCDHGCTFCSIPTFRGKHRSKPIERVVQEAEGLAATGAREINLVAQDVTAYGMDLYRELALPKLLGELDAIDGIDWIRLLYCYPTMVTDKLIDFIAAHPKVLPYIDVPLQHADDSVLLAMKRGGSASTYLRLFERLRSKLDNVTIRTTFIVGFPGETDQAFDNLMAFVKEARFDRLGVFEYSKEDGTPAGEMDSGEVPRKVARARKDALMRLQMGISAERNAEFVGKSMSVLIEGYDVSRNAWVGRSYRDAPEIDGCVFVASDSPLALGSIVGSKVTGSLEYDLLADFTEGQPLSMTSKQMAVNG